MHDAGVYQEWRSPAEKPDGQVRRPTPAATEPFTPIACPRVAGPDGLSEWFLTQLGLIDHLAVQVGRHHHLPAADLDDFASVVRLRLLENNYAVLRRYQGRGTYRTYLTVVITRMLLDMRTRAWGKWRSSATARRLGPTAVRLERLMMRDGLTFDEACNVLRSGANSNVTVQELQEVATVMPRRVKRRTVGESALASTAVSGRTADEGLWRAECARTASQVGAALSSAIGALRSHDRLVLTLRFANGLQVSEIARLLDLRPKPLYRRIERLLTELRRHLEALDIHREHIADWLGDTVVEMAPRALQPRCVTGPGQADARSGRTIGAAVVHRPPGQPAYLKRSSNALRAEF